MFSEGTLSGSYTDLDDLKTSRFSKTRIIYSFSYQTVRHYQQSYTVSVGLSRYRSRMSTSFADLTHWNSSCDCSWRIRCSPFLSTNVDGLKNWTRGAGAWRTTSRVVKGYFYRRDMYHVTADSHTGDLCPLLVKLDTSDHTVWYAISCVSCHHITLPFEIYEDTGCSTYTK